LKIEEVLKQVRISVQQKTQNKQIPWESSSLIRDFYFSLRDKNPGGGQQKETVSGTHSNEVTKGSRADPIAMELKLWESIENSNNPEDFKAYLSKYPNGTFAELARDRSNTLSLPGTTEVGSRPSTQPDTAVEPLPAYYRTYTESKVFQVGFPGNWRKIGNKDDVMFAPEGAYRRIGKKHAITKGVAIGLSHSQRQLPAATDELVSHLRKDSPGLKQQGDYQGVKLAGREGILVVFSNTSEITGDVERIGLHTCLLPNGDLFYVLEVAPHAEYKLLKETLDGILKTIRITERVKSDR
jgi:hypothetical protein